MSAVAMAEADAPRIGRSWSARLGGALRFVIGVLFCLTPVTALLALGWLTRMMRAEAAAARARLSGTEGERASWPNWITAPQGEATGLSRWGAALWWNLREGAATLAALIAGTTPFTLLILLGWWGGWENSFNKGYEQAWVGIVTTLAGYAVALPLLARLPMALAHMAVERRMSAFFAWGAVRRLIRAAGWRYVALSLGLGVGANAGAVRQPSR